jgi:hypothetical protein
MEIKNKEIESKDKIIISIGSTNKKLLVELDELKREVDDKLDKIGMKQLADKEKEIQKKKKDEPYELLLRTKEKELKNTMNLLEILKKDKENLKKNLEDNVDLKKVRDLEDKLKLEQNKNKELEIEIKLNLKLKEEYNKSLSFKENFEKEKEKITNEVKYYKDKNKDLLTKLREEEEKQYKVKNSNLNSNKSELSLPDINQKINSGNVRSNRTSNELNLEKYWKLLDNADNNLNSNSNNNNDNISGNGNGIGNPGFNKKGKKLINKYDNKKNFSDKLRQGYFQKSLSEEDTMKLFGREEKDILLKLLPQNEVDKLEKKFEFVQRTKIHADKKNQLEIKQLSKKVTELEERIEYTNLHNKELEQRNKISGYQINEYKNENKILVKKFNEANVNLTNNKIIIKQKDEDNRKIHLKLQDLEKEKENLEKKIENIEIIKYENEKKRLDNSIIIKVNNKNNNNNKKKDDENENENLSLENENENEEDNEVNNNAENEED